MTRSPRMPTQVGDVLVLRTKIASRTLLAVGRVATDGQQDFCGQPDVTYVRDLAATMGELTAFLQPGRRLFVRDLDARDWSEIAREDITRPSDVPSRDSAATPRPRAHADTRLLFRPRAGKADVRPARRFERAW